MPGARALMSVVEPGIVYPPSFPEGKMSRVVLSLLNNTPFTEQKAGFSSGTIIFVSLVQAGSALPLIELTVAGISTDVIFSQLEKAPSGRIKMYS